LRACSALSANLRIEKGYVVHGTSRDGALARLDGLIALGIADLITLRSMSPADFQSVAQVIEAVAADEIYNLSGQSSVTLSFAQPAETLTGISLGTLNMLETGLTLRNTMSDVPVRAWGRNPRPPPIQTQRTQRDRAIQLLANDLARSRKSRQSSAIFLSRDHSYVMRCREDSGGQNQLLVFSGGSMKRER